MISKLLFWKRKKKEDEDEAEDVEESKSKKKRRKRKKKKKPEPWGKRERILVFSVLMLTVLASGISSIKSNGLNSPSLSLDGFRLPSFNFLQEETIVLYGTQDEEKDPSEVVNSILNRTSYLQGEYAVVVVRLDNGFRYGVNDDTELPAASLVKLPVMAAMFKAHEEGTIDLDDEYVLKSADKVDGSGSLSSQPEGYRTTYRELVKLMGQESDNTAFRISRTLAGRSTINEVLDDAQMTSTSIDQNNTTADDIASYYENLWTGNLINSDNRDELLEYLTNTIYEDWITRGVPEEVRVAHKYGVLENVVNDSGIVYANSEYILVVMSSGVVREEANLAIPEISKIIYELESSN